MNIKFSVKSTKQKWQTIPTLFRCGYKITPKSNTITSSQQQQQHAYTRTKMHS